MGLDGAIFPISSLLLLLTLSCLFWLDYLVFLVASFFLRVFLKRRGGQMEPQRTSRGFLSVVFCGLSDVLSITLQHPSSLYLLY